MVEMGQVLKQVRGDIKGAKGGGDEVAKSFLADNEASTKEGLHLALVICLLVLPHLLDLAEFL